MRRENTAIGRLYKGTLDNQIVAGTWNELYHKAIERASSGGFKKGVAITLALAAMVLAALASDVPKKAVDHFSIPMNSIEEAVAGSDFDYTGQQGQQYR